MKSSGCTECRLESAKLADAGKMAAKFVLDVDTLAKSATHFASWWGTVITILNGLRKNQKRLGDSTTTDQKRARSKQCERSWKQIKQEYCDYRNQVSGMLHARNLCPHMSFVCRLHIYKTIILAL